MAFSHDHSYSIKGVSSTDLYRRRRQEQSDKALPEQSHIRKDHGYATYASKNQDIHKSTETCVSNQNEAIQNGIEDCKQNSVSQRKDYTQLDKSKSQNDIDNGNGTHNVSSVSQRDDLTVLSKKEMQTDIENENGTHTSVIQTEEKKQRRLC